jgi:hypothetical protein
MGPFRAGGCAINAVCWIGLQWGQNHMAGEVAAPGSAGAQIEKLED